MRTPFFSVIVPTFNRPAALAKCLACLSPEVQQFDSYELIVTDDSLEHLAQALIAEKFGWAKWIQGPAKGPAANRNNGARQALGEWLIFIDDDCVPDEYLLSTYLREVKAHPDTAAFEGAIFPERLYNSERGEECPVNMVGEAFWSANIAVKREVFEAVGGFDEFYPLAALEDMDLHYRLLEQYTVRFSRAAFVVHPVEVRSLRKKIKRVPQLTESWAYHAQKHSRRLNFRSKHDILLKEVVFYIKNGIKAVLRGDWRKTVYYSYYFFVGNWYMAYFLYRKK